MAASNTSKKGGGGDGGGGGGPAIGIDLGTTYSCAAVRRHNRSEVITNDQGNRITPSCVAFTADDRFVGDAAENQAALNPTNTIFEAKRLIGRRFSNKSVQEDIKLWPFKVVAGPDDRPTIVVQHEGKEMQFVPEEISAMVLSKLRDAAVAYLGEPVTDAVITVPVYFNNAQREATLDAAAIAYGLDKMPPPPASGGGAAVRTVLIFDLGGGTLDVSLLNIGRVEIYDENDHTMSVVIPRNTFIPAKNTQRYTTHRDMQTSVSIKVFEGESASTKNNYLLGEFVLSGITPAPAGVARIDETLEIDANGVLHVFAEDMGTGSKNNITITNHSGRLKKEDVERMSREARSYNRKRKRTRSSLQINSGNLVILE
ncbi:hypothetical protein OsI_35410 [Oryza sativa Indica Group]|uniref:Uncharacterized protein n=1 Tax=Oryza sativa subsp. indica TaxID=39946 RepID=B8BJJ0_ORYSI|nr:hypothetical protein OsI_35410 [Oryza sativa Indica Group]